MKQFLINLWARIKAEESAIGKMVLKKLAPLGLILSGIGQLAMNGEVLAIQQYLDPMVFKILAYCSLAAAGIAKLTKRSSDSSQDNLS